MQWRVDAPAVLLILPMARADRRKRARQRDAQIKRLNERGVADRRRRFWEPPVVENSNRTRKFVLRRLSHENPFWVVNSVSQARIS